VTENIFPNKGRFPEHDNEIMISTLRSKFDGLDVGDSIVLSGRDNEQKYIISGIVGSATNGGMNVYLTTEGFKKIHDGSAPDLLEVFLNEGEDKARFEKKVSDLFGGNAEASLSAETAGDSEEERIRAVAEKKIAALLTEYGVNGVDYAVNIDGKVIKGNSYHYAIKDMMSFRDLMKSQLGTLAEAVKAASVAASVIVFLVVAVILNIVTSSLVKKKRKDLGIMKGLGYSSGDLMTQLAWSIMPTVIAGTLAASITGNLELAFFGDMAFGIDLSAGIILTAAADILLILFCYLIIRLGAGKIKKISVNELITE
jgi:sulfur carrier protein ThiS